MLESMDLNRKGAYFMSCFLSSLSRIKSFVIDVSGLRHHLGKGRLGPLAHVEIPLMIIFKGETYSRHHIQAVISKKVSKSKVR